MKKARIAIYVLFFFACIVAGIAPMLTDPDSVRIVMPADGVPPVKIAITAVFGITAIVLSAKCFKSRPGRIIGMFVGIVSVIGSLLAAVVDIFTI